MASLPDRPAGFSEWDARISGWFQTQDRSGARGRAGPPRARRWRGGRALRRGDDALGGGGRRGRSDPRGGRGLAESPRRADRPPGAGRHLRAALPRRDLRSRLLDRRAPPHAGYGGGVPVCRRHRQEGRTARGLRVPGGRDGAIRLRRPAACHEPPAASDRVLRVDRRGPAEYRASAAARRAGVADPAAHEHAPQLAHPVAGHVRLVHPEVSVEAPVPGSDPLVPGGRVQRSQGGRSMSAPAPAISAIRSSLVGRYELAYRGLILFTILLYLRPNELLPIGTFPLVKILTIGTLAIYFLDKLGQGGPVSVMPRPFKYVLAI